jgi:hypothetical protein
MRRFLLGAVILAAFIAADEVLFRVTLGVGYLRWYLVNGAFVQIVSGVIGSTLDLNEPGRRRVIAAGPNEYLAAWLQVAFEWYLPQKALQARLTEESPVRGMRRAFQLSAKFLLRLFLSAVLLSYLILAIPAQYLIYLPAGVPARVILSSPYRASLVDRGRGTVISIIRADKPPMEGEREAGVTARPVTLTNAIAALLLFLLRLIFTL